MPQTPVLDQAAFGNGRVLALVAPSSAIEWLCLPRFDSPSVFARLLDAERGGTFRILAGTDEVRGVAAYQQNTNVVATRFDRDGCAWEVIDFAPRIPDGMSVRVPIEIARIVRPLHGQPRLSVDLDPRPDYARAAPQIRETADCVDYAGGAAPLCAYTNLPLAYLLNRQPFALTRPLFFVLSHGRRDSLPTLASTLNELDLTVRGWRQWAKSCALPLFAPAAVLRSALCLKLHAYHDTGAIIAAATTSIPEALGTERTWDYRYCWLRDAAFVVEALRRISHLNEGERFVTYLRDVVESAPLQPLYGIGGESELPEHTLDHLAGFAGNGHVRIGNAAAQQRQHDLMGEIILCLHTILTDPRLVHDEPHAYFPLVQRLVEDAIALAPEPDTGIWEFRSMLRPYTFSRAMCWAAIDRGATLARLFGEVEHATRWEAIARGERQIVLQRGFNQARGYFTQSLDGEHPDAANLLLPMIGIIDARDPRFVATVDAYQRELVEDGLVLRYRNPDDFGATTSAFTICSFWMAEALALMGRLDQAVELFNRLLAYANPVGLFSEDIDPKTGMLLGNFPQAYTHVGLIHAAMTIGELLDVREGHMRTWY